MRSILLSLLLGIVSTVSALSAVGSKLLVILEDESERSKYTQFWTDLETRGFQVTYRTPKDSSLSLFQHGEPAYSHLLMLPTKAKGLGPALTPNLLAQFVNAGSNVLLALSSENAVPSAINALLLELDIQLSPDRSSLVVDHFNYDVNSAAESHDVLLLPSDKLSRSDVRNFFSVDGLVAFPRAVGQVLGNASPLLSPVVRAPNTAYMYSPKDDSDEEPFATGSQVSIVTAFQALNNARLTVLGSSEALEDQWFDASIQTAGAGSKAEKSSNKAFASKLAAWTFKEAGVLKVDGVSHFLNEGRQTNAANSSTTALSPPGVDLNPTIYRIKNDVHYAIAISEWSNDHWTPYVPPAGDAVQVEVSMLSPFHRLNLLPTTTTANATIFTQTFKLPDQHGIFNFFVEYRRPFLTTVEEKRTVTVRHFAHDEWPRSWAINGAWPSIGGIWVTIAGWLAFVALWLYSKPAQEKSNLKVGEKR